MTPFNPSYTSGTHRLVSPEETLARIEPHLLACGITRCAEVTGLDRDLGTPVYCAIRPQGLVLQSSNGKGLTKTAAKVSALMEAIELHHAETPPIDKLRQASWRTLMEAGLPAVHPSELGLTKHQFYNDDYQMMWVAGQELVTNSKVWIPASAVYFCQPTLYRTSSNGLASGNHLLEATLHALYELIERDAVSKLNIAGRIDLKNRGTVIDPRTIPSQALQTILGKINTADSKLVLIGLPSAVPVHTFWAVLLNKKPMQAISTFNAGYGTHFDMTVAATRAITEAVQSRLTLVHGGRDDMINKPIYSQSTVAQDSPAYRYFDNLSADTPWAVIDEKSQKERLGFFAKDLKKCYDYLRKSLIQAGHQQIIRVDLTQPNLQIPVVKLLIPSLSFTPDFF